MKIMLYTLLLIVTGNIALAQKARFITSGSIEFQRTANTFAILRKMIGNNMDGLTQQAYDQYKKTQPQFKTINSTLTFNTDKTLYTPAAVDNSTRSIFGPLPMAEQNNLVYTDLATKTGVCQKNVFEEVFLIKDTLRKIKWKITDETREIAGYTCRRANALILDSIYVVAFYTDQIPLSGGPESFTGLPGMILQVALPHENVVWLATKVTDTSIPVTSIVPAKKGKAVTFKEFEATLQSAAKNRGPSAPYIVRGFLL